MFDNIWLVLPKTKDLVSPYDIYEESKRIEAAEPFTVSMVTVVVAEDLDGILRGSNDVLVLTKSSLGEQPFVERIHYYEEGVQTGRPIRNLFADTVFITDDYNGIDRLWLELNVLEIDTDTGERKAAIKAFQSLAATAGAVFPAVVPYTFAASAAGGMLEKLVSAFEKDTNVVKVPFSLHSGTLTPGKAPLQAGTYVVFAQPQDPNKYKMQTNGLLTTGKRSSNVSYAVFSIAPQKQVSPNFVLNQKIATLLTQVSSGNANAAQGTIAFLNSTLRAYANFSKLNRFIDLKKKAHLTEKEKVLMTEIMKVDELEPFLPKG